MSTIQQLDNTMKYFEFLHLPTELQKVSKPFAELADKIYQRAYERKANQHESLIAIRKLLEAKDCAVRASIV